MRPVRQEAAFANRDRPRGDEAMKCCAGLTLAIWASLGVCTGSANAQARWSVGFSVGSPGYYRPYYPYYYYRPYPGGRPSRRRP
jgi:hypothetical protein